MTKPEILSCARQSFSEFCKRHGFERTDTFVSLIYQAAYIEGVSKGIAVSGQTFNEVMDHLSPASGGDRTKTESTA